MQDFVPTAENTPASMSTSNATRAPEETGVSPFVEYYNATKSLVSPSSAHKATPVASRAQRVVTDARPSSAGISAQRISSSSRAGLSSQRSGSRGSVGRNGRKPPATHGNVSPRQRQNAAASHQHNRTREQEDTHSNAPPRQKQNAAVSHQHNQAKEQEVPSSFDRLYLNAAQREMKLKHLQAQR